jgi:hypothetical protein
VVWIRLSETKDRIEVCRMCFPDENCSNNEECETVALGRELKKLCLELSYMPVFKSVKRLVKYLQRAAGWKKYRNKLNAQKLERDLKLLARKARRAYSKIKKKDEEMKGCRFFEIDTFLALMLLRSRRFRRSIVASGKAGAIEYFVTRNNVALIVTSPGYFYVFRPCRDEEKTLETVADAIERLREYGDENAVEAMTRILEAMGLTELAELIRGTSVLLG